MDRRELLRLLGLAPLVGIIASRPKRPPAGSESLPPESLDYYRQYRMWFRASKQLIEDDLYPPSYPQIFFRRG